MSGLLQALADPLLVASVAAIAVVGVGSVLYLRAEDGAPSSPPMAGPRPVAVAAPVAAPASVPAPAAGPPLAPAPALASLPAAGRLVATSGAPGRPKLTPIRSKVQVTVPDASFADVAGVDEVVEELREIKEYLLDPERFRRLGATLPRGILLAGPPGTGKTLLTKALAGEAGVPFQAISAASLVEVYVGVGPARIRSVFAEARKHAPSIVLLDELDAIGRTRAGHPIGGSEERESTLNQLLVELDGFDPCDGVLVVGSTNRPDVLDPALLRPGRFDRRLVVGPPDLRGRRAILGVHTRDTPLDRSADLDAIARRTPGLTGADLANVVNEAALLTGRRHQTRVGQAELEEAIDRLLSGPQRPNRLITTADKRVIAYHEAGHAVVGWCLAASDDLHRISMISRGNAHGYTLSTPAEDRVVLARSELAVQLAVLLGGRVAEELVFTDPTTGAKDDLERATALAGRMVVEYGMSDAVGPVCVTGWGDGTGEVASEIRRLLLEARATATTVLTARRTHLDRLAERLIVDETLDKAEIDDILADVPRNGQGPTRTAGVDCRSRRRPKGRPAEELVPIDH